MIDIDDFIKNDKGQQEIDHCLKRLRDKADEVLRPLATSYYPAMIAHDHASEFNKMRELSTKMMLVGQACAEIAGYEFNDKLIMLSALFGGCCFLGDSFIDDYDDEETLDYINRLERLLTKGWFEISDDREKLFYVIVTRLFSECDVFEEKTRQAIFGQFLAQKRDALWRLDHTELMSLSHDEKIDALLQCANDRGGYVTLVLSLVLTEELSLHYQHILYLAGKLFMHIDDHGDHHQDKYNKRFTYMNSIDNPADKLEKLFNNIVSKIKSDLPENGGRDILTNFLTRYYHTRLKKHILEQNRGSSRWVIYE
ncbi:MAG: hypothetical protein OEV42_03905 [Deltaproteobacteria bacterium]|nr:hypothetical protein [Deltaproteobacteria bacterium]